uniref:sporulation protein Cse60 n=1 Tax=Paenibacillus sp. FSL L8-0436 TaxID=2954686 RepID=UPI00406D482C
MIQVRCFSSIDESVVERGINAVFSGLKREKLIDIKYSISTCPDSDTDSLTGFITTYSALVIYEE